MHPSQEQLKSIATASLGEAEAILRNTPIDETLAGHGWTEWFAEVIADTCAKCREDLEANRYEYEWGGGGLMRQMQDEISPTTSDVLKESVAKAYDALRRYCDSGMSQRTE